MNTTEIIKNAKGRNETANETISAMRKNVETLQDALENWNIDIADITKKAAESTLRQHNEWAREIKVGMLDIRGALLRERMALGLDGEEVQEIMRNIEELEEIRDKQGETVKDLREVEVETEKVVSDIRDAHKIAKTEEAAAEEATEEEVTEVQVLREQLKKAEAERDEAQRTETTNTTAIIKNAKGRNETANETISAMRKNVETLQDALENWDIYTAKKAAESTLRQHNKWERAIQADRMDTREVYTTEYRDNKELEEIVAMDDEMVKDLTKVQSETAKAVRDIRDAHKIAKIEAEQARIEAEQAQIEADMAEGKKAAANLKADAEWEAAKKAATKKAETEEAATEEAETEEAAAERDEARRTETMNITAITAKVTTKVQAAMGITAKVTAKVTTKVQAAMGITEMRNEIEELRAEVTRLNEKIEQVISEKETAEKKTEEVHAESVEDEVSTKPEANEDETETTKEDDEIELAVLNAKANDARAQEDMELMKRDINLAREVIAMGNGRYVEKSQATKLVRDINKMAKRSEGIRTQTRELVLSGKGNDALRECMDMEKKTQIDMAKLQEEAKKVADEIRFIAMRNGQ